MKIVGLEIKKIKVGNFFPKESKVELDIFFNDGDDKEILKIVDSSDPESSAESILIGLRKLEKNIHKDSGEGESIIDNALNIVVKNEDILIKETSKFIQKVDNKMEEIKNKHEAEGYLDIIRELKNMKLEF